MAWTDWFPQGRSRFSIERTKSNADFILASLSSSVTNVSGRARASHPILRLWDAMSSDAHLRLNWLAEDLRLLVRKPGFGAVSRDLDDENACLSAWHTIHVAALVERARPNTVVRFVDSRNDLAPDFIMSLGGVHVPVEAKLLMRSKIQASFNESAAPLAKAVLEGLGSRMDEHGVRAIIHVADALNLPRLDEVLPALTELGFPDGRHRISKEFEVAIETLKGSHVVPRNREAIVLSPIHDKDHLRVRHRANHASKQLRALETSAESGILALALENPLGPAAILSILDRQMQQGRFRGIGATILVKTVLRSPISPIAGCWDCCDRLEIQYNRYAHAPLEEPISLGALGLSEPLLEVDSRQFPAYQYSVAASGGSAVSVTVLEQIPDWLSDAHVR